MDKLRDNVQNLTFVITTAEELDKKINQSRMLNETIFSEESVKK